MYIKNYIYFYLPQKVEDLQDQLKTSNIDIVAKIRFDGDSNHQGFDFMFNKLKVCAHSF